MSRCGACRAYAAPLLPELPPGTLLPARLSQHLTPSPNRTASHGVRRELHGRCLVLLGSSTMAEAAHDLAVLLGANFSSYVVRATHMHGKPSGFESGKAPDRVTATFYPNHRNFTLASASLDSRVYSRQVTGWPRHGVDASGNYLGIRVLDDPNPRYANRSRSLRRGIAREVAAACGSRPREVWLNTGDHEWYYSNKTRGDPYALSTALPEEEPISREFERVLRKGMQFVETLAPSRAWVSRHLEPAMTNPPSPGIDVVGRRIEAWAQSETARRAGWRYVDHRQPWSCLGRDVSSVPLHTGAIARGYWNRHYDQAFLSTLRTLAAVWTIGGARNPCDEPI